MYIDSIDILNVGPIDKFSFKSKFNENGNPYPIVVIGDNGKGKTVLSSYVADSIVELAKKAYNDIVEKEGAFYKIISNTNIKNGRKYGATVISFVENTQKISYVEKSGEVDISDIKNEILDNPNSSQIESILNDLNNKKKILGINDSKDAEKIFDTNVLCFFPSYRSEKPIWMNETAIKYNEIYNLGKYNGQLNKEIIVEHSEERNSQWMQAVITDSLIDIIPVSQNNFTINGNASNQQLLKKAKENLEKILKAILKVDNIELSMNYRNQNNSFKINCREILEKKESTTLSSNTLINSLKHFSLGQAVLFNMFATIIRHADINDIMKSINLSDISGIVVIDEIDMHLDSEMQHEVLPKLIELFPKIQFIITTHSPLFLLGMDKVFRDKYSIIEMPKGLEVTTERFAEFEKSYKYLNDTKKYEEEINDKVQKQLTKIKSNIKPLVITEGKTDWRHIKGALSKFKKNGKYIDLDFDFLEFEYTLGESELINMKDYLIKLPNPQKIIFIADRDTDAKGVKELEKENNYKDWENNVYSFRIPVPQHRNSTPEISIEHYYTDAELKTEIECDDKVIRRLYFGNDFNNKGLNTDINKRCDNRNKCGKDKIVVLSGSDNEKVFDMHDEEDKVNYALSKYEFVQKVVNDESKNIGYDSFSLILDKIQEIIKL